MTNLTVNGLNIKGNNLTVTFSNNVGINITFSNELAYAFSIGILNNLWSKHVGDIHSFKEALEIGLR